MGRVAVGTDARGAWVKTLSTFELRLALSGGCTRRNVHQSLGRLDHRHGNMAICNICRWDSFGFLFIGRFPFHSDAGAGVYVGDGHLFLALDRLNLLLVSSVILEE